MHPASDGGALLYSNPRGGRHLSGAKVLEDDQRIVMFGAMPGVGSKLIDRDEIAALTTLKFHLREALAVYEHLCQLLRNLGMAAAILNQFSQPMRLIDDERAIHQRIAPVAASDLRVAQSADDLVDRRAGSRKTSSN